MLALILSAILFTHRTTGGGWELISDQNPCPYSQPDWGGLGVGSLYFDTDRQTIVLARPWYQEAFVLCVWQGDAWVLEGDVLFSPYEYAVIPLVLYNPVRHRPAFLVREHYTIGEDTYIGPVEWWELGRNRRLVYVTRIPDTFDEWWPDVYTPLVAYDSNRGVFYVINGRHDFYVYDGLDWEFITGAPDLHLPASSLLYDRRRDLVWFIDAWQVWGWDKYSWTKYPSSYLPCAAGIVDDIRACLWDGIRWHIIYDMPTGLENWKAIYNPVQNNFFLLGQTSNEDGSRQFLLYSYRPATQYLPLFLR